MTRYWLAGIAAVAMMTGVALAQGVPSSPSLSTQPTTGATQPLSGSTQPTTGSNNSGLTTSSMPSPPPLVASPAPANPNITNYGTGGMQALPGTAPNIGNGTR